MSFVNDFAPENAQGFETSEQQEYPQAFGITFTPPVQGIVFGGLGIAVAGYLWINFVQPARQAYQSADTQRNDIQQQIDQQSRFQADLAQIEQQLQQARARQQQVLDLLPSQATLNTLLLDLEQIVTDINSTIAQVQLAVNGDDQEKETALKLIRFAATTPQAVVVNDGSLGSAIDGKVKRQTFAVEVEGSFAQVQALVNEIERLQPLLAIKNFQVDLSSQRVFYTLEGGRLVPLEPNRLEVSFLLDAVLPLEAQERAQAQTPPSEPQ